jgi:hypothetical protein
VIPPRCKGTLPLSPYSLKALLRKAAERTVPDLWDRIGVLLAEFSAEECSNYFRHAGYA